MEKNIKSYRKRKRKTFVPVVSVIVNVKVNGYKSTANIKKRALQATAAILLTTEKEKNENIQPTERGKRFFNAGNWKI